MDTALILLSGALLTAYIALILMVTISQYQRRMIIKLLKDNEELRQLYGCAAVRCTALQQQLDEKGENR